MLVVGRVRPLLLGMLSLSWMTVCVALPFTELSVDLWSFKTVLALVCLLTIVSFYCRYRMLTQLACILEVISCGIVISIAALVASYVAMSFGHPLVDTQLRAMDETLGFDWSKFLLAVDSNALLSRCLFAAYVSFPYQLMVIPCLLIVFRQAGRAYCMIAGYGIICLASSVIAIWYPALSAYSAHHVDPRLLHNVDTHFAYAFLDQFNAVASGKAFVLSKDNAEGIVTFPSVHAAVACLCAWAGWTSRYLRYPLLILNIAMAISAISHGSHFLVDIIAGVGVAGLSIAAICFYAGDRVQTTAPELRADPASPRSPRL